MEAQLTLEHTFNVVSIGIRSNSFNTDAGIHFYTLDGIILTIYNVDYSLYKKITLPALPTSQNASYSYAAPRYMSNNLFDNDNFIEFIMSVIRDGNQNSLVSTKLYDENLNVIKDFGDYNGCSSFNIVSDNNSSKLLVQRNETIYNSTTAKYTYSWFQDVYSLPSKVINKVESIDLSSVNAAYPNPSKTIVNLTYSLEFGQTATMKIYNEKGQVFDQKQIDSHFDKISLNVDSYKSGIYFYEYNGKSKKFIVN